MKKSQNLLSYKMVKYVPVSLLPKPKFKPSVIGTLRNETGKIESDGAIAFDTENYKPIGKANLSKIKKLERLEHVILNQEKMQELYDSFVNSKNKIEVELSHVLTLWDLNNEKTNVLYLSEIDSYTFDYDYIEFIRYLFQPKRWVFLNVKLKNGDFSGLLIAYSENDIPVAVVNSHFVNYYPSKENISSFLDFGVDKDFFLGYSLNVV